MLCSLGIRLPLNGSCLIAVIASGVDASSSLASSSLEEQTTSSVAGTPVPRLASRGFSSPQIRVRK